VPSRRVSRRAFEGSPSKRNSAFIGAEKISPFAVWNEGDAIVPIVIGRKKGDGKGGKSTVNPRDLDTKRRNPIDQGTEKRTKKNLWS